jgi:hypothetical protein
MWQPDMNDACSACSNKVVTVDDPLQPKAEVDQIVGTVLGVVTRGL